MVSVHHQVEYAPETPADDVTALAQTFLDAIPHAAALVDERGAFVVVNGAWFAAHGSAPLLEASLDVGDAIADWPARVPAEAVLEARQMTAGVTDVVEGRRSAFGLAYTGPLDSSAAVYRLDAATLALASRRWVLLTISQARNAEADAALLKEFRYRSIVEQQRELVCRLLPDGTLTFANRAYARFRGCRPEDLIGRNLFDLGTLQPGERWQALLAAITPGNPVITFESLEPDGTGRDYWLQWSVEGLHDDQGRLLALQCAGYDVTALHDALEAQRRSEEALRESEALLRSVTSSSPVAILMLESDGSIRFASRPVAGRSPKELVGHSFVRVLDPDGRTDLAARIDRCLADGVAAFFEFALDDRPDGPVLELHAAPVCVAEGVTGLVVNALDVSDRRRAELESRRNEQRYRDLFETVPVMMLTLDADHRITDVNAFAAEKLGRRRDDIVGRPVTGFFATDSGRRLETRLLPRLERDELVEDVELRVRHASGQFLDVLFSGRVEPRTGDDAARLHVILVDVTERKRASAALRETQARFERAVQGTSDGLWDWDLDTGAVWYAPRFKELLGYADSDFSDRFASFRHSLHPDDRGSTLAALSRHLDGREPLDVECRLRMRSGAYRWFRIRGLAHGAASGGGRRMSGSIQDVTEQKLAEATLREVKALYELILDNVPAHIAYVDTERRLQFVNRRCRELFGLGGDDYANTPITPLIRVEDRETLLADIEEALSGRAVARDQRWAGEEGGRSLSVEWVPHVAGDGSVLGFLWVARDVTRQRQLEAELLQAQKMEAVGQLTGGIAHDFNNLLSIMLGNLQLLERRLRDDPVSHRKVDTAVRAAIRGAELTRRLLAFSRQQMLAPELVDMNALVTGMEDLLRRSLGDAVEVVTDFAPGLWPIEADPGQLENALLNLAINGRDAMPDGGRLTLRTRNRPVGPGELERHPDVAPGEFVTLAVTDNGTGIAAEHVSQVFEPFFTTKEAGKGSGLGLSMVYGFVEQSGGFVDIDSQPGLGTTVTLHFPRCTREGAVRDRAPPPQAGELPRGSETVLVVEDEEDVRETVVSLLGELGYRVLPVATPGEALETLAREPDVAVLFTDVMMPGGIRGTQLAQRARELRPKLRVLYTTGFTSTGILQREMLSERAEMIGKPYTNEELAHVLRGLLDENG